MYFDGLGPLKPYPCDRVLVLLKTRQKTLKTKGSWTKGFFCTPTRCCLDPTPRAILQAGRSSPYSQLRPSRLGVKLELDFFADSFPIYFKLPKRVSNSFRSHSYEPGILSGELLAFIQSFFTPKRIFTIHEQARSSLKLDVSYGQRPIGVCVAITPSFLLVDSSCCISPIMCNLHNLPQCWMNGAALEPLADWPFFVHKRTLSCGFKSLLFRFVSIFEWPKCLIQK